MRDSGSIWGGKWCKGRFQATSSFTRCGTLVGHWGCGSVPDLTFHWLNTGIPTHPLAALETVKAVAVIQAEVPGDGPLALVSDHWTFPRIDLNW